jgi:O-antigen ligase/polysaccharide polymerase Wzy-like membrane protein
MDAAPALSAERPRRLGAVSVATGVVAFLPVFGLAIAQGGYFPASWGWASVPLLWCAAIALVLRAELRLGRAECIFLGALVAFAAWIACSIAWSAAPAVSVLETQRALVYVAAPFAVLVLAREGATRHILAGALAAVSLIAAFSLATRVLPDRIGVYDGTGVYRLAEPIGYWNGLALFTAMGALVALGFAARDRSTGIRAGSGALLVLLLPTMYFTFGRGAWIALAVGVVAAVAVDPRRLQLVAALVALAPAPALALVLAARERGLTHEGTPLAVAARDGHRFALVVVGLAAANAGIAAALAFAGRVEIGRRPRMLFVAVVLAVAVGAVALGVARYGGPVAIAQRAYDSFKAPPPNAQTNLNRRLLNFSGNGRVDLWRVAWAQATEHPVLGAGAGAYERYFVRHQPSRPSQSSAQSVCSSWSCCCSRRCCRSGTPADIRSCRSRSAAMSRFSCMPPPTGTGSFRR